MENTEKVIEAAKREVREEIGLDNCNIEKLEAYSTIPAVHFKQYQTDLDCDTFLVEELTFAIQTNKKNVIRLCDEHTEFMWMSYEDAIKLLEWDSNKTALWELDTKLKLNKKRVCQVICVSLLFSCHCTSQ